MLSQIQHFWHHSSKFAEFLARVAAWFNHELSTVAAAFFLSESAEIPLRLRCYQGLDRFQSHLQDWVASYKPILQAETITQGYCQYMIIPLIWQEQFLGLLVFVNILVKPLDPSAPILQKWKEVQTTSLFLSRTIHDWMLATVMRRQKIRWKLLQQWNTRLWTAANLTQIAYQTVETVSRILPCRQIWIGFMEYDWIKIEFGLGISEQLFGHRIRLTHAPLLSWVIYQQQSAGPWSSSQAYDCRNFLIIPILAPKFISCCSNPCWHTRGVLYVKDPLTQNRLNKRDQEWLSVIADQVGIALCNQELYEEATTDFLTGTYRRGYFLEFLEQKMQQDHDPLALLMIDIDFFKLINDTYGHPIGDALLQQLAEVLRRFLGANDFLGRYGGEEFAILLSHCNGAEAYAKAEQIRQQVGRCHFGYPHQIIAMTVSIGVAQYQIGETLDQWLLSVDTALYQAKNKGRNCVYCA